MGQMESLTSCGSGPLIAPLGCFEIFLSTYSTSAVIIGSQRCFCRGVDRLVSNITVFVVSVDSLRTFWLLLVFC